MKNSEMIEKLATMIKQAEKSFLDFYDLFGVEDLSTQRHHARMTALEDAFEAVTGVRYFEWCMKKQEALLCAR